eukprot:9441817-Alexandrium_andersonii.AAC.1
MDTDARPGFAGWWLWALWESDRAQAVSPSGRFRALCASASRRPFTSVPRRLRVSEPLCSSAPR